MRKMESMYLDYNYFKKNEVVVLLTMIMMCDSEEN